MSLLFGAPSMGATYGDEVRPGRRQPVCDLQARKNVRNCRTFPLPVREPGDTASGFANTQQSQGRCVLTTPPPPLSFHSSPRPITAVYGIARVLQESGDHTASRELLLFLGERSQEILRKFSSSSSGSAPARNNPTNNDNGPALHHQRRLCFPLRTGDGAPGIGGGLSGALVLPAAPAEVMWRVARASMAAKDWPTAILALRGLAASYATGGEKTSSSTSVASSSPTAAAAAAPPPLYYFASFAGGGGAPHGAPSPAPLSLDCPGPGRARALRALAFCQIQRGLYRDALETVRVGLGEGGAAAGGGTAEADDAAMLMLRADALVRGWARGEGCWGRFPSRGGG